MLKLSQCFSALIASGHGQRCNEFRYELHDSLLVNDDKVNLTRSHIFKYGSGDSKLDSEVKRDVSVIMAKMAQGVDIFYFGDDLKV